MNRDLKPKLALLLLIVLIAAAGYLTYTGLSVVFRDPGAFHARVTALGVWGPVVIVASKTLQVLMAPIPGQVIGMTAGYLYGYLWGTLYCMLGLALGSWLNVWLARRLGRPLVERVANPKLLQRLDDLASRHGVWAFFLVFLFPFFPDDVACLAAGLTPLPIGTILVLAIIGRLPGVFFQTWLGATAQVLAPQFVAPLVVLGLISAALMIRHRAKVQEAMFSLMRWLGVG